MAWIILAIAAAAAVYVDPAPRPPMVAVAGQERKYLAGPNGNPLYVFNGDGETVECADACAVRWPPLLAGMQDATLGEWRTQLAPGDRYQWVFRFHAVHIYTGPVGPNGPPEATPDGRWSLLRFTGGGPSVVLPASARVRGIVPGYALTDWRGRTLYSPSAKGLACAGPCLDRWQPLAAPASATPIGDWVPVDRPDGIRQWAWHGRLAYTFTGDMAPGDMHGVDADRQWRIMMVTAGDASSQPGGSAKR